MFRTLMTSRRFAPLFWCQFFSAFNDNFVRNMLVMLILFRFGGENASLEILLATIVFILPSIPLSALGGEIGESPGTRDCGSDDVRDFLWPRMRFPFR